MQRVLLILLSLVFFACQKDDSNTVVAAQDPCYGMSGHWSIPEGEVKLWPVKKVMVCMAVGPRASAEIVRRNSDGTYLVHITKRWRPFLDNLDYAVCSISKETGELRMGCGQSHWVLREAFS